ncbi:hypothetical protein LWT60_23960, partial [Enterobacter hormaechei]|nr:hypothetical protein [Enterobacter hormaechei]
AGGRVILGAMANVLLESAQPDNPAKKKSVINGISIFFSIWVFSIQDSDIQYSNTGGINRSNHSIVIGSGISLMVETPDGRNLVRNTSHERG